MMRLGTRLAGIPSPQIDGEEDERTRRKLEVWATHEVIVVNLLKVQVFNVDAETCRVRDNVDI